MRQRLANADEFINSMPLGYDTIVGERGGNALRRPTAADFHCPGRGQ